jgi:dockerin type I repeat protein
VPLTNVVDARTIQITLNGVNGSTKFAIPIGDTNGNGTVNASDLSQTKSRVGHAVDGTNFRSDVNANGYIDVADVSLVKSSIGTGLS